MPKTINFDMDGTIADLYGVDGWLDMLRNSDPTPYLTAKPLLNMSLLARYLNKLTAIGYEINIISWTSKSGTPEYNLQVSQAKMEWLNTHLKSVSFTNIFITTYGTPKAIFADGILFDDEQKNRDEWNGTAYDETDIIATLKRIIQEERG